MDTHLPTLPEPFRGIPSILGFRYLWGGDSRTEPKWILGYPSIYVIKMGGKHNCSVTENIWAQIPNFERKQFAQIEQLLPDMQPSVSQHSFSKQLHITLKAAIATKLKLV